MSMSSRLISTLQRSAISSVVATASGWSRNMSSISASLLKKNSSEEKRIRFSSDSREPVWMHSRTSWAAASDSRR